MEDREIAFWFLTKFCGENLCRLNNVNFGNRLEKVSYDYVYGGCKSREDYEYLVESYRIFQELKKDNWIIVELLK